MFFGGSAYAFLRFSNLSCTLCLDNKYTMVITKLQDNSDRLALTIAKISNILSTLGCCFVTIMGLVSIIKVKEGLNVFFYYPNLKICLNFNGSQPTDAYKRYAYKRVYIFFPWWTIWRLKEGKYSESIIRFESTSFEIFKGSRVLKYQFGFVGENRELTNL